MRRRGRAPDLKRSLHVAPRGAERPEGILIEASVVARLLGMRLLKLDATVVLVPADTATRSAVRRDLPAIEPGRASDVPPRRAHPAGRGLAEAVRHIQEGEELLAEARHNGASRR